MGQRQKQRSSLKSNAGALFNRYVWLVDTIFQAGRISFEEINNKWMHSTLNDTGEELPVKTFHNHKNAIQQMFDIDIACDRRDGYLYFIEHAEDMEQGGVRKWLLNTFAVNHLLNESHHLKRRILFEDIPSGQRFLTTIIEAMRDSRTLELTYRSFNMKSSSTFEVHPYCVKVFRQRWYMVAYSPFYDELRIYALDRVEEIQTTENRFKLPKDFDAKEYFADAFGIIIDKSYDVEQVEVKVFDSQREYFRTLPLHVSQAEVETTPEYSVFEYHLRPTFDFVQEMRRYGSNVEIIEPLWLRGEFAREAARLATQYQP